MNKSDYTVTIGLEIHAELKTRTKMFCDSKNDPDEIRPNVNICPVCMGYPGTLPVINKEAVYQVLRVGVALGGTIADFTEFDRKNYFYPDIPKGYQISQYKYPLVQGGSLRGVTLTRIHLEEDTARSSHEDKDGSLVDFNRAGVPLMELVTEPVLHSAEDAAAFARELQLTLQYLGAGDANMEKGEMRVEANISVSKTQEFGTKVEVKNLNSFRAVEKAIAYEMKRHTELLERGEKILQETRGWDENKELTFSQRTKEDSHDYRYFPEPDLPKLWITKIPEFSTSALKESLPELPWNKRARYIEQYGIRPEDAEFFVRQNTWSLYFESAIANLEDNRAYQIASNYITSDLAGLTKAEIDSVNIFEKIPVSNFSELIMLTANSKLSSRATKDILKMMYDGEPGTPSEIANKHGLLQKSDESMLSAIVDSIIDQNPNVVSEYKNGKTTALQFLVGQGMKLSKGSANPGVLKSLIEKKLQ